MHRLSSGSRINSAGDDPSGFVVSERLRAQIRGSATAARGIQDHQAYLRTADSWMQKIHDMLHRMNELAISSNDGTKSDADRANLQVEFQQLQQEIARITTGNHARGQFNNQFIFDGGRNGLVTQVGADAGQLFCGTPLSLDAYSRTYLGRIPSDYRCGMYADYVDDSGEIGPPGIELPLDEWMPSQSGGAGVTVNTWDISALPVGTEIMFRFNAQNVPDRWVFEYPDGTVVLDTAWVGSSNVGHLDPPVWSGYGPGWHDWRGRDPIGPDIIPALVKTRGNNSFKVTVYGPPGTAWDYRLRAQAPVGGFPAEQRPGVDVRWSMVLARGGAGGHAQGIHIESQQGAMRATSVLRLAIDHLGKARATMGTEAGRLAHSLEGLQAYHANTMGAESQIRDTDMARESTILVKRMLLAEVGTAMLAQANVISKNVIQLLGA